MYFQFLCALDRVKALAPQHPEWKDKEPFASLLKGDLKGALAGGEKALMEIVAVTHAGMATQNSRRSSRIGFAPRNIPSRASFILRWPISPCSNCSPICARTDSKLSSSP